MGLRIIKTAAATFLAILVASWVGLPAPLNAGLLAILGVDVTIKRSIRVVSERFGASVVALILGCVMFYVLGFKFYVLPLYILIAFPLLVKLRMKDGILPSTVAVFHIFVAQSITVSTVTHEVISVGIGLGAATIVNFIYMPSLEQDLLRLRDRVDQLFADIFNEIEKNLLDHQYLWCGKEILDANQVVQQGITLARRGLDNRLLHTNQGWYIYFMMRQQQLQSIERMLGLLSYVLESLPQNAQTASLFAVLSEDVKIKYYTGHSEEKLRQFIEAAKEMPLPETRAEFEIRSALLQMCRELEQFLAIARNNKEREVK